MSTYHHITVESGRWQHPIAQPMQIGLLMGKYVLNDSEYNSQPGDGPIRTLEPGEEAVLILHHGSILPWVEEIRHRFENDVAAYFTCRDSKTLFHAILPASLHRLPHGANGWEREPMDVLPAGLLETIQRLPELMERMRFHCERVAMSRQFMPGCTHTEGAHIYQLSLCDLLRLWQSGGHPWVATSYHDGPFLTYRIEHDGTAHAWSTQLECPVQFNIAN